MVEFTLSRIDSTSMKKKVLYIHVTTYYHYSKFRLGRCLGFGQYPGAMTYLIVGAACGGCPGYPKEGHWSPSWTRCVHPQLYFSMICRHMVEDKGVMEISAWKVFCMETGV